MATETADECSEQMEVDEEEVEPIVGVLIGVLGAGVIVSAAPGVATWLAGNVSSMSSYAMVGTAALFCVGWLFVFAGGVVFCEESEEVTV